MATDITVTRRRKLLAHLAENGGEMPIGPLHDWAGLKLLAAHQVFSELMEGLVQDELLLWDGKIFTLTDAGRKEAALGPKSKAKKAKVDKAESAPAEPVAAEPFEPLMPPSPAVEAVAEAMSAEAPAPDPLPAVEPEDAHDHGHSHDHGHAHEHPTPAPAPKPVVPSRPRPHTPPPNPKGLRGRVIGIIKRLLKGH